METLGDTIGSYLTCITLKQEKVYKNKDDYLEKKFGPSLKKLQKCNYFLKYRPFLQFEANFANIFESSFCTVIEKNIFWVYYIPYSPENNAVLYEI